MVKKKTKKTSTISYQEQANKTGPLSYTIYKNEIKMDGQCNCES